MVALGDNIWKCSPIYIYIQAGKAALLDVQAGLGIRKLRLQVTLLTLQKNDMAQQLLGRQSILNSPGSHQ